MSKQMKYSETPIVTVSGTQLSDLFFNFEHPHFDELVRAVNNKEAKESAFSQREAIAQDAQHFASIIDPLGDTSELVNWLTNDFMDRV